MKFELENEQKKDRRENGNEISRQQEGKKRKTKPSEMPNPNEYCHGHLFQDKKAEIVHKKKTFVHDMMAPLKQREKRSRLTEI